MSIYSYPGPRSPGFKKPTDIEDCLPQARILVKKEHGRAAMGPVKKNDRILIITFPDQDEYVREAVIQAFKEEGAEKVDFLSAEFIGRETKATTVEDGWREIELFKEGRAAGSYTFVLGKKSGADIVAGALRKYFDENPGYTKLFWDIGGRTRKVFLLKEHGAKFKGNWLFNNWEEFLSRGWTYPDELEVEIERRVIATLGTASEVRITDPEGTHLEYTLKPEEAKRWQRGAWMTGHLLLEPHHATTEEAEVQVSTKVPPLFLDLNGVLAGTANHCGFFPRIELHFEHGRLVNVKGGGRYGDGIRELVDKYKEKHWPGYPEKGFFWYCDCALCTVVKAFRRMSDMLRCYWWMPNVPERNRAGVFHMGFGSRRHGEEHGRYATENNLPTGHIHVHNYFATFEIKLQSTENWYKVVDKGWITAMGDPEIRALAVKYGDPDELLNYDWIPPLPGINCEGDYLKDYAPDPVAYLRKRKEENKPI